VVRLGLPCFGLDIGQPSVEGHISAPGRGFVVGMGGDGDTVGLVGGLFFWIEWDWWVGFFWIEWVGGWDYGFSK